MESSTPRIITNPSGLTYTSSPSPALASNAVFDFHQSLPTYTGQTNLIPLPTLAKALNIKHLFLKDESFRFGDLPSFKPLGISWAIRNGIIAELSEEASTPIPDDISLADLAVKAKEGNIKLIAASDGKLGKIVARLGKMFGVEGINTRIFIPEAATCDVKEGIKGEGAEVIEVPGDFEDAMREACLHAVAVDGVLIDIDEVENYVDVPRVSLFGSYMHSNVK
jgi:diaminopropionate ammonia-lyase